MIGYVVQELNRDPNLDLYCLVDSIAAAEMLAEGAAEATRPIKVLLECGMTGARTGARSAREALAIAERISQLSKLSLSGVETYEHVVPGADDNEKEANIVRLFDDFVVLCEELERRKLFGGRAVILSAGGSAYFDLAAAALNKIKLSKPTIRVIRSGCYLTFDYGWLPHYMERMRARSDLVAGIAGQPTDALEVWGYILSRPEPGLAVINLGKRDVSFDVHMPLPKLWLRPGLNDTPQAIDGKAHIAALNDQHANLQVPAASDFRVGDMIGVGISHPCTTFDKWRTIMVVNDRYDVVDAISTWF